MQTGSINSSDGSRQVLTVFGGSSPLPETPGYELKVSSFYITDSRGSITESGLAAGIADPTHSFMIKPEKSAHDIALEGYEEHDVADLLMREISRLSPSDDKWTAKFTVLKENVEHHVEEEESEIWAKAREILDEAKAQRLGEAFASEKEKLLAKAG